MPENSRNRDLLQAKRSRLQEQLRQLAVEMEKKELNPSPGLAGLQNNAEQLRLTQSKIQAGKLVFEIYASGQCFDGRLCQILDDWSKKPDLETSDWNDVQGFESICWEWYGNRFERLKQELGELSASAHVIWLLLSEFQRQDLD
jgi:hypothetical protein